MMGAARHGVAPPPGAAYWKHLKQYKRVFWRKVRAIMRYNLKKGIE